MKYVISISLLTFYLVGSLQSSWVLIDFYMHRDDYTQKYCRFLDEGITQCRASCYLNDLLEEQQKDAHNSAIVTAQQPKTLELFEQNPFSTAISFSIQKQKIYCKPGNYQFDFQNLVFHPPKV